MSQVPTSRVIGAIGLALLLWIAIQWVGLGGHLLVSPLVYGLLIATLLLQVLFQARRPERLRLHVGSRHTCAGQPFVEEIELQRPDTETPLRELTIHEPRTRSFRSEARIARLAPGERTRVELFCRSMYRGRRPRRRFEIETRYPLGLFGWRTTIEVESELITEPRRLEIPVELLRAALEGSPSHHSSDLLDGREYHSLREHAWSEDARRVHALRSASLGTLVRRVERGHRPRVLALVLDLRRAPGAELHLGQKLFEWKLSACATLLDELLRKGVHVHCLTLGAGEPSSDRIEDPSGARGFLAQLAGAAPCEHSAVDPKVFEELQDAESCYWIDAAGFRDPGATELLGGVAPTHIEPEAWK